MAGNCCNVETGCSKDTPGGPRFRRALWAALIINAIMFVVEFAASLQSGSVSLLADAIDFLGDAANYIISLTVLSMGMLWRARAAWLKGLTMFIFGIAVLARAGWVVASDITPEPLTMGVIGGLALVANVTVAVMLYAFRSGDADMRSVWLCSRNDAIGNVAVMVAAAGVFGTGQAWPDLVVAGIMGTLALTSGASVMRHARSDLRSVAPEPAVNG
ncbi:cation transporter [Allohahella marinimesophila]|uniref:Cation diffusion facilitator family transporter n=1 Tax=Allohahella marinimesophila TaxID=1054972 RepID=A0ABP7PBF2_9GAMM